MTLVRLLCVVIGVGVFWARYGCEQVVDGSREVLVIWIRLEVIHEMSSTAKSVAISVY